MVPLRKRYTIEFYFKALLQNRFLRILRFRHANPFTGRKLEIYIRSLFYLYFKLKRYIFR